jgi:hypothetical protein
MQIFDLAAFLPSGVCNTLQRHLSLAKICEDINHWVDNLDLKIKEFSL